MMKGCVYMCLFVIVVVVPANAQDILTLQSCIDSALLNHPSVFSAQFEVEAMDAKSKSIGLTDPVIIAEAPYSEKFEFGFQQSLENPFTWSRRSRLYKEEANLARSELAIASGETRKNVSAAYLLWQLRIEQVAILFVQDSLLNEINTAMNRRFDAGDIGIIAKTSANVRASEYRKKLESARLEAELVFRQLELMTGVDLSDDKKPEKLTVVDSDNSGAGTNPIMEKAGKAVDVAERNAALVRSEWIPDLTVGYINQVGPEQDIASRFNAGITIPIWFWEKRANQKHAESMYKKSLAELQSQLLLTTSARAALESRKSRLELQLAYYDQSALGHMTLLRDAARQTLAVGTTDLVESLMILDQALDINLDYLETIYQYNLTIIELEYLNGK